MGIDICVRLGRRIRQERDGKGLNQDRLAQMAGISREALSRIENGSAEAGIRTLAGIARALDVKLSNLIEGLD